MTVCYYYYSIVIGVPLRLMVKSVDFKDSSLLILLIFLKSGKFTVNRLGVIFQVRAFQQYCADKCRFCCIKQKSDHCNMDNFEKTCDKIKQLSLYIRPALKFEEKCEEFPVNIMTLYLLLMEHVAVFSSVSATNILSLIIVFYFCFLQ